jgi:hypothetical protein
MRSRLVTLLAVLIAAAGLTLTAVRLVARSSTPATAHASLGLVWFDTVQHDGIYHQDWRIENDPQATAAFRLGLSEPTPVRP